MRRRPAALPRWWQQPRTELARLRNIAEVAGQDLVWSGPLLQDAVELRASDDVVATLRFEKASMAIGKTAQQQWTFDRKGFWNPRVVVQALDSNADVAAFKPAWFGGGTVELSRGRHFRFVAANFWRSKWDWTDQEGNPVVHFKGRSAGFLKWDTRVEIEAAAVVLQELPLLVVLGRYLQALAAREAPTNGG